MANIAQIISSNFQSLFKYKISQLFIPLGRITVITFGCRPDDGSSTLSPGMFFILNIFKKRKMEDLCLRCGKCCYGLVDGIFKPCPYLKELANGKTECIIYPKRLGTIVHKDGKWVTAICGFRKDSNTYIEGCPLNPKNCFKQ